MSEFTPGPWAVHVRDFDKSVMVIASGASLSVANVTDYGFMPAIPNARLMAAAPDLLAACKALIDAPHQEHFAARLNDDEMRGIEMIRAAISKAEGAD